MMLRDRSRRPSTILIVISLHLALFCLPIRAQDPPQGAPVPGGPEPRPRQLLRQAQRPGPQAEEAGQELVRLLNLPEVRKALALSEEQNKKLEEIAFNARKASIQQAANLEVQRLELQRFIQMDNPDRPAIEKKITEITQAQAALMRTHVNALVDARSALNKEQMQKVRDYLQRQNRQRMQQRAQQRVGQGPRQPVPAPAMQAPPLPPPPPPPPAPR